MKGFRVLSVGLLVLLCWCEAALSDGASPQQTRIRCVLAADTYFVLDHDGATPPSGPTLAYTLWKGSYVGNPMDCIRVPEEAIGVAQFACEHPDMEAYLTLRLPERALDGSLNGFFEVQYQESPRGTAGSYSACQARRIKKGFDR